MKDSRIRVLHIKNDLGLSGAAKVELDFAEHMADTVCFDWLVLENVEGPYEKRFCELGGRVFCFPDSANRVKRTIDRMAYFFRLCREEKYQIVHFDTDSLGRWKWALMAALAGVKVRIIHSHNSKTENAGIKYENKLYRGMLNWLIRLFATDYLACSEMAGLYMFGKKGIQSKKFLLLRNGINLEKFQFNSAVRQTIREDCGVADDTRVFGFVGRFVDQKNPLFLLEVFAQVHSRLPGSVLWLFGDGELRKQMEETISSLHLENCVTLWGQRQDIPEFMNAMDALLFPSKFEGLGIAAIEAQTAGLPVFASDAIPEEASASSLFFRCKLSDSAGTWADSILTSLEAIQGTEGREDTIHAVRKAGYDIGETARLLEELYMGAVER